MNNRRKLSGREREIDELLQGIKDEKKVKVDEEIVQPQPAAVAPTIQYVTADEPEEFKEPEAVVTKKRGRPRKIAREIRVLNQNEKPRSQKLAKPAARPELEAYADEFVAKAIADAKEAADQLTQERQMFNVMAAFINAADEEHQPVIVPDAPPEHPTRFTLDRGEAADLSQALHGIESHGDLAELLVALADIESAQKVEPVVVSQAELAVRQEVAMREYMAQHEAELAQLDPLDLKELEVKDHWYTPFFENDELAQVFGQFDEERLRYDFIKDIAMLEEAQKAREAELASVLPVTLFKPVTTKAHEYATSLRPLKKLASEKDFVDQVNSVNANLETPLYLAVMEGHIKAVEFLLPHCTINTILQKSNAGVNSCELVNTNLLNVQKDKKAINRLIQNRLTELNYVPGSEVAEQQEQVEYMDLTPNF